VNVSALAVRGNDLPTVLNAKSPTVGYCGYVLDDTLETSLCGDEQVICVNHHISG
jgi:hypothetical protein